MNIVEEVNEIMTILKPVLSRGWCAELFVESDCVTINFLMGGDCNCPHPKNYDPNDGHGFTIIREDDFLEKVGPVPDERYNIELAKLLVKEAMELEGTPFKDKNNA